MRARAQFCMKCSCLSTGTFCVVLRIGNPLGQPPLTLFCLLETMHLACVNRICAVAEGRRWCRCLTQRTAEQGTTKKIPVLRQLRCAQNCARARFFAIPCSAVLWVCSLDEIRGPSCVL